MPITQNRFLRLIEAAETFSLALSGLRAQTARLGHAVATGRVSLTDAFAEICLLNETVTEAQAERIVSEERIRYNLTCRRNEAVRKYKTSLRRAAGVREMQPPGRASPSADLDADPVLLRTIPQGARRRTAEEIAVSEHIARQAAASEAQFDLSAAVDFEPDGAPAGTGLAPAEHEELSAINTDARPANIPPETWALMNRLIHGPTTDGDAS